MFIGGKNSIDGDFVHCHVWLPDGIWVVKGLPVVLPLKGMTKPHSGDIAEEPLKRKPATKDS